MLTFRRQSGFTLIELLLVAIILGILAAVVVPQFATNTVDTKNQALKSNLAAIRSAIDLYTQQHDGAYPGADAALFTSQLTSFTTSAGAPTTKSATSLGPYLRAIPAEPISGVATVVVDADKVTAPPVATGEPGGWLYYYKTGQIIANYKDKADGATPSVKYGAY